MGALLDMALSVPVQGQDDVLCPAEPRRQRVTPEAELVALVNLVADAHGFSPEDRQEALTIALSDAASALICFRALVAQIPGRTADGTP